MKKLKRTMMLMLALWTALSTLAMTVSAAEFANERMTTNRTNHAVGYYGSEKKLETAPVTFEAWVYLPQASYSYEGVILGNSYADAYPHFSFGVVGGGIPQLSFGSTGTGIQKFPFKNAKIQPDTWTHLTIVYGTGEGNKQSFCYLDGELKDSTDVKNWHEPEPRILDGRLCLGGDRRQANEYSFRGSLRSATMYADVRTPEEVKADASGNPDLSDSQLLVHYDLADIQYGAEIADASGNGYDMQFRKMFLSEEEYAQAIAKYDDKEYTYSIGFLPDIQIITMRQDPQGLTTVFDYFINNKESKNIQYLITLGDLTHNNTQGEWDRFKAQTERLNGVLPYSLIRGNHDITHNDGIEYFDQYYSQPNDYYYQHVEKNGGFFEPDFGDPKSCANTYLLFSVGEVDYIILNLDFGAQNDILSWANEVLSEYSDRRAIVVTHGYLSANSDVMQRGDSGTPSSYWPTTNDGDDLWEKVLRKHANVNMVVCGHIFVNELGYSQAIGDHGNVVHQVLMNYQGLDSSLKGVGVASLMHFTEDGRYARVEQYATLVGQYMGDDSWLELDFGEAPAKKPEPVVDPDVGETPSTDPEPVIDPEPVEKPDESGNVSFVAVLVMAAVAVLALVVFLVIKKKKTK